MMRLSLLVALMASVVAPRAVPGQIPPPAAPAGLRVELRTVGHKATFHLSETIPLEIAFSSAKPATYAIELADGWNVVPQYDRFRIDPAEGVLDRVAVAAGRHRLLQ